MEDQSNMVDCGGGELDLNVLGLPNSVEPLLSVEFTLSSLV